MSDARGDVRRPEPPAGPYTESGGFRIHYEATGDGPPLLLLNGWSASGLLWPVDWIAELARTFRVLRMSFRGTGWSDAAEQAFTMSDLVGDALAVLDAEGHESASVLGLSMGGMVAQQLAMAQPNRTQGLVLMSTAPPWPEMVVNPQNVLIEVLSGQPAGRSRRELFAAIWPAIAGPGFPERHPDRIAELIGQAAIRPTRAAVIALQYQAILGHKHPERLAELRVPTLVIHGDADRLLPVDNGRALARLIPGARYVELPDVGHLVPWEAPDESLTAIRETLVGAL